MSFISCVMAASGGWGDNSNACCASAAAEKRWKFREGKLVTNVRMEGGGEGGEGGLMLALLQLAEVHASLGDTEPNLVLAREWLRD